MVEGAAQATQVEQKKVKPLTPKEVLTRQIEEIEGTQTVNYQLPEDHSGWLVIVGLNSQYPGKGKKYAMKVDRMEGGQAGKSISTLWESNNAKDMANWILDRQGKPAS